MWKDSITLVATCQKQAQRENLFHSPMWLPDNKTLTQRLRSPSSKGPPPLQSYRTCVWASQRQPQLFRQYQLQAHHTRRTALRTPSSHRTEAREKITDQSLSTSAEVSEETWVLCPIDDDLNDFSKVPFPVPASPHLFTAFYSFEISSPFC